MLSFRNRINFNTVRYLRPTSITRNLRRNRLGCLQVFPGVTPVTNDIVYIQEATYLIGHGIILFTMFYCGLNWAYYREMRKRDEDKED